MRLKIVAVYITIAVLLTAMISGLIALQPQEAAADPGDSPADPIFITDLASLQNMSANLSAHYALNNSIDASATSVWNGGLGFIPIGNSTNRFTGSFDGRGFSITGLFINRSDTNYVGLFGYIDSGSSVGNVSLVSMNITGKQWVGGLVGYNYQGTVINSSAAGTVNGTQGYVGGLAGFNRGTVNNSHATGNVNGTQGYVGGLAGDNHGTVNNSYATGNVSGRNDVGGLLGYNHGGTVVNNSYATGNVTATADNVGGLVGYNSGGAVNNSYATGAVNGSNHIGGLVGLIDGSGTVSNSYAIGNVSGQQYIGGLVGYNNQGAVNSSYATGNVSGISRAGGLVGWKYNDTLSNSYATGSVNCPDQTGGLVGYHESGAVSNCYATGAVNGSTNRGGLVGLIDGGTVTASFYDLETTGQNDDTGKGEPKTTAQMKTLETFTTAPANWDIQGNATNNINNGYPFLSWQIPGNSPVWYIYTEASATPTPPPTATSTPTPTPTPTPAFNDYGGDYTGGGGGWSPLTAGLYAMGQGDRWEISSDGYFLHDAIVSSDDGSVTIFIPSLTKALGPNGLPVSEINVNTVDPPPAPSGMHILAAFAFEPGGATFSPGIEITISFDPSEVAAGETVVIAFFNEVTGSYEFIEGTINADGTATFTVSHFTIFAVMAGTVDQSPTPTPSTPATTTGPTATAGPAPSAGESGGLSAATWIGIAVGVILVILIVILAFRRRSLNY